jgi:hypothetical protein
MQTSGSKRFIVALLTGDWILPDGASELLELNSIEKRAAKSRGQPSPFSVNINPRQLLAANPTPSPARYFQWFILPIVCQSPNVLGYGDTSYRHARQPMGKRCFPANFPRIYFTIKLVLSLQQRFYLFPWLSAIIQRLNCVGNTFASCKTSIRFSSFVFISPDLLPPCSPSNPSLYLLHCSYNRRLPGNPTTMALRGIPYWSVNRRVSHFQLLGLGRELDQMGPRLYGSKSEI